MAIYRRISNAIVVFLCALAVFIGVTGVWTDVPQHMRQVVIGIFIAGAGMAVGLRRDDHDPVQKAAMPLALIGVGLIFGGVIFR